MIVLICLLLKKVIMIFRVGNVLIRTCQLRLVSLAGITSNKSLTKW